MYMQALPKKCLRMQSTCSHTDRMLQCWWVWPWNGHSYSHRHGFVFVLLCDRSQDCIVMHVCKLNAVVGCNAGVMKKKSRKMWRRVVRLEKLWVQRPCVFLWNRILSPQAQSALDLANQPKIGCYGGGRTDPISASNARKSKIRLLHGTFQQCQVTNCMQHEYYKYKSPLGCIELSAKSFYAL